MTLVLALLIGIVAGLRTMTAPAAISIAAATGRIDLAGSGLGLLAHPVAAGVLALLALGELVTDQLPSTPSRKVPVQFGARLVTGGLSGAAIGAAGGTLAAGAVAGIVGAVIGTLGGAAARGALARGFGRDRPAALIEDAVAILGAVAIVAAL